jgi:hypothetical protein
VNGAGWPDRVAADRLLDGGHADTPLGRVLAHARGPVAPHELCREGEVAAAFRSGERPLAPARARRAVSRVLTLKVAVVGVLLTGSGLAVAGVTGTLPGPPLRDQQRPAPVEVPTDPAPTKRVVDKRDQPAGTPDAAGTPAPRPSATPTAKAKGPNEHARSPHPRGNSAHPTPGRKTPHLPAGTGR